MDSEQIISHGRARFNHEVARRTLKEKYQAKLIFTAQGGMWRAGPELMTTLLCCTEESVLLDLYETPVKVNTFELLELTKQHWQEQMNAWHIEYEELNKNR